MQEETIYDYMSEEELLDWFRELVENCVVYGDRGYRGCTYSFFTS